uniref:Uncharacterized protein n=1 Tax=Romanomermis culicivorax TaxID=13658 RepID=A0A915I0B6_ROMCU
MQIKELDDQQHKNLHESGAPQREGMLASNNKPSPSNFVFNLHKLLVKTYYSKLIGLIRERRMDANDGPEKSYDLLTLVELRRRRIIPKGTFIFAFFGGMEWNTMLPNEREIFVPFGSVGGYRQSFSRKLLLPFPIEITYVQQIMLKFQPDLCTVLGAVDVYTSEKLIQKCYCHQTRHQTDAGNVGTVQIR